MTLQLVHRTPSHDGASLGFALVEVTPAVSLALADLMYGDPGAMQRFIQKRRTHMNLLRGILQFSSWSVTQPVRAFSHLLPSKRTVEQKTAVVAVPRFEMTAPAEVLPLAETSPLSSPVMALETMSIAAPSITPQLPSESTADPLDTLFAAEVDPMPVEAVAPSSPAIVPADWKEALLAIAGKTLRQAPGTAFDAPSSSSIAA